MKTCASLLENLPRLASWRARDYLDVLELVETLMVPLSATNLG